VPAAAPGDQPPTGRLVLLSTTHRVAAGLLSYAGWAALASATEVYAASADHPLAVALDAAQVPLRVPAEATSAAERAALLLRRAGSADGDVVWLLGADGDAGLTDALAQQLAMGADSGTVLPEVELVAGSWDLPGARLLDLVAVMDRLRSPGGCPWDAEQTHRSLLPYLLEEAYETVEAVETDDLDGLREELGDLLLQVVFHARLGEEHPERPWSVDDVAAGIVDKLVARHPHVFGPAGEGGPDAEQVDLRWDELKRAEKGRRSAVDGVPLDQPALALAAKLVARAGRAGVGVPVPAAGWPAQMSPDAVGAALLALAAAATRAGVDAEAALRAAARGYAQEVRRRESGPEPG
jgi:XTP/dITP diphosphohydrolase